MGPLLRNCWWSFESPKDFVGGSRGLLLYKREWNIIFFTGTGKHWFLTGKLGTSHGSVFPPLQLMFYLVPGVKHHSWMGS